MCDMPKIVYLYRTSSGKPIITHFIDKLDPLSQARIRNAIRLLTQYGFGTSAGHSIKKLSSRPPLFELRIGGSKPLRLLFITPQKDIFFIIHIFSKKTQKTPLNELRLAQKRAQEIIEL